MADAVLTRDRDDCEAYRAALAAIGLGVVAMPVTRAVAIEGDALARELAAGDHAAVVVTSRRAAAELARAGLAPSEVWVVGEATAAPLAAAGIATIHPAGAVDGASLARALVAARKLAGRRVLVPRAADGRTDALDVLRAAGAIAVDLAVYRVEPVAADAPELAAGRALLAAGQAAACVTFAPSQVAALAGLVGPLAHLATRFCAIGQTTAAALREAGVQGVAVASTPTPQGIAQAVRAVYPPGR